MNWIIRNIIISSVLASGVFYFVYFSETGLWPVFSEHWLEFTLVLILANLGGIALYLTGKKMNHLIPWSKNRSLRFLVDTISGLLLYLALGWLFLNFYVKQVIPPDEFTLFWDEYWDGALKFVILITVLIYIVSLVNFSIFSYNQYAVGQIESLRLERDQKSLQFEALKSQLSPHYLFNSLNTISSLMYKDIRISENFIRKLAGTYQYILNTDNRRLVSLAEEVKMVEAYFYMQKIKYGDCIQFEVDLPPTLSETLIPPLSLQMLAENALKHNRICDESVLKIGIYNEDEKYIVVRNNINQKPELLKIGNNLIDRPDKSQSHKIGLKNIRKRYLYFTHKEIEVKINEYFPSNFP
ncbi:MAG: histidine kinase [Bacteroidales bacterium]